MNWLDILGWGGAVGLLLFYWFMGSQKVMRAYVAVTLGAACWLINWLNYNVHRSGGRIAVVGDYGGAMVIGLNVRAMIKWYKKKVVDKEEASCPT